MKEFPDQLIFEQLFKQYHPRLIAYAFKFVSDIDVAKDLVQDAFIALWNNYSNLKDPRARKSYLFTSVRNNCLNHLNRHNLHLQYQSKEMERKKRELLFYQSGYQSLVEKELTSQLENEIEKLPDSYKTSFKMARVENLKTKEIAERLNIPVRTVETQIFRAMKILRDKLSDQTLSLFYLFRFNQKKLKKDCHFLT